jgi:WD40 repeat protein
MAKYPAQRFASAAAMLAELQALGAAATGQVVPAPSSRQSAQPAPTVTALPAQGPRRWDRWPRRLLAGSVVLALALGAVLLWKFWQGDPNAPPAPGSVPPPDEPLRWTGPFRQKITPEGYAIDLKGRVETVAFSHDGRWLAAGTSTEPRGVCLWNCASGEQRYLLPGQAVRCVAFSPNSKTLAAAAVSKDGAAVILLDLAGGTEPQHFPLGGTQGKQVRYLAFPSEGQVFAAGLTGPDDPQHLQHLVLWEPTLQPEPLKAPPNLGPLWWVAFAPHGQLFAVAGQNDKVTLWTWPDKRLGEVIKIPGLRGAVAFSPDAGTLVTAWEKGPEKKPTRGLTFFDIKAGEKKSASINTFVGCSAFSPNGKLLALGQGGVVSVRDGSDGQELRSFFGTPPGKGEPNDIRAVAFSPDSEVLASASLSGTLTLCDVHSLRD